MKTAARLSGLFNLHGAHLVFGRAAEIVQRRVGEPICVPVLEVKRHPGFARIRFLRYAGGRKDFAASGRHPYVIAVLNPEPSRVLRADFDRKVAGNRVDVVRLIGHGTGVVVPEDATRRQHEGVVLVGKFGSGPVLSGTVGTEPALQVHAKAGNNRESAESSR